MSSCCRGLLPLTPPCRLRQDFPGDESIRQWNALTKDTRSLIQLIFGFFVLPLLISASLRAAVIEPLLYYVQADTGELNLTHRQWNELTEEARTRHYFCAPFLPLFPPSQPSLTWPLPPQVEHVERRLRYDARMGHSPPLSEGALEEKLREEGVRLEEAGRVRARDAVGNTLSDSLGTLLLLGGFYTNRARLFALRRGVVGRFLALEVSTQAFLLLLAADITVGYHSSDGWVTFCEVLVERYNADGAEGFESFIRLFVAIVPVVLDVMFKYWVYKSLRKLSPGTQIILSEIERH